jgi:hypothetical protein
MMSLHETIWTAMEAEPDPRHHNLLYVAWMASVLVAVEQKGDDPELTLHCLTEKIAELGLNK